MNKWEEKRLENIIDINPPVKLKKGAFYPFIDIDKVSPTLRSVTNKEVKLFDGQSSSKFCDGDTVFSRITPCLENRKIAKVSIDGDAAFGSTEFYVFRAKKGKANASFTYYLTSSDAVVLPAINSMTGASGRQRADKRFIQRLKLNIPDLPTQERIADILSTYDTLIENNNKRINLLEQMAENLYKEWFSRFRFPGHENAEFEDGMPCGWVYMPAEDLASVLQRGISPVYDEDGAYIIINQKCIRTSIMDIKEAQQQSKQYKEELNLQDCDTVICSTGTGTLGRVGKVYGDYENTTFDSHVTLVRTNNTVGKHYLYFALKQLQPWFMSMGIGSTNQQELYRRTIKSAKVLVPNNETMNNRFEAYAQAIHEQITVLSKETQNLIKQRDMLLPRLMSGKLEV